MKALLNKIISKRILDLLHSYYKIIFKIRSLKYKIGVICTCVILTTSCKIDNKKNMAKTDYPSIQENLYGDLDGKMIKEYTLTNHSGTAVTIINYGGTVTKIMTKDKTGTIGDVVLGFDSLSGYLQKNNPYFGCLIGRYGNRIGNATFRLDEKKYTLAANNNGQSLHGGVKGFDKVVWSAEKMSDENGIKLTYISKDGDEGYPGNLTITVTYTLNDSNGLTIDYTATTDKATPINLTNHCYFNLSDGKDSTILDHILVIEADKYTEVNDVQIPTGVLPDVTNTPMDFRKPKRIGENIHKVQGGYDHNWVLNKGHDMELIASLFHPHSGRMMDVFTTEPCVQFYSGNFLDGSLQMTKNGQKYVKHAGLCLETQHFPDSPNQPSFPS